MNKSKGIIIIIALSLILGLGGFFGTRYYLTEGAGSGISSGNRPPKGYKHPYISSATAVLRPPSDSQLIGSEFDLTVTIRNDSPSSIVAVYAHIYAMDSDEIISMMSGEIGSGGFPSVPIKPGETITYTQTSFIGPTSTNREYYENGNLRIGILYYMPEVGDYTSVYGSSLAHLDITKKTDLSEIFLVPIVVSDKR